MLNLFLGSRNRQERRTTSALQATMALVSERKFSAIIVRLLNLLIFTGTARVDCLALNGDTPAPNYTDAVVQALGLTYVS